MTFQALTTHEYSFAIAVPSNLQDETYFPVLLLSGQGIGDNVPGNPREIEIHWEAGDVGVDREYELLMTTDATPPEVEFQYFKSYILTYEKSNSHCLSSIYE